MRRRAFAALGLMAFIAACSPAPKKDAEPTGLTKLKLATDWRASRRRIPRCFRTGSFFR